ncbi:MAG TPA: hypothetical protein VN965_04495 [Candidatus Dormibacteraeota bacterium]|nr:hypothetical protein [Candidatus Dormibacteraeota bacterium]
MRTILRALTVVSAAASVLLLGSISTAAGNSTSGSVEITTTIDFSSFPFKGTFAVVTGEALLGCSGGSFMDTPMSGLTVLSHSAKERDLLCTSGQNSGSSFSIVFQPTPPIVGGTSSSGHWQVLPGASGPYANMTGGGDFSVTVPAPNSFIGHEDLTGTVQFTP